MPTPASAAPGSLILGTGHYLPQRVVTNEDLAEVVETSDDWIRSRTGIAERRFAREDETTSDLAAAAARLAIENAGLAPTDIDLIIVATVTGDVPLPATATYVQQKIGARNDCPAFDVAAACAGFIYGLAIADKFVRTGSARHVLVVGVELLSRVLDFTDRRTCVLFGDGAGAVVLGPPGANGRGVLSTHLYSDGSFADALTIPAGGSRRPASHETLAERLHYVHMDGGEIFKLAVRALSSASRTALDANGLSTDDVDWVVPHQANTRILDAVGQRLGVPMSRFYVNIERVGNTSSASIPIALDEGIRAGVIKPGQLLLFTALGGGISWGSAVVRL